MEIIHIVLGKANPDRLNGVNKVVYNLATEQQKAGKMVQLWGITSDLMHNYPSRNFKTLLFKAEKNPFRINTILKQQILEHQSAVFHFHGGWIPVFYSLSKFLAKHQIKFVITPHGAYNSIAMERSQLRKTIYFNLFEKHLIKKAYKTHSIGQSEVDGLKKLMPTSSSYLLPYGFETEQTIKTTKNNEFTIGFVGRIDMHTKGLDLLLEAFYNFQKKVKNTKLWIIGNGKDLIKMEKFIHEKQLKNVVFWGKKFGNEKDELISKMHVFAHPSRNEGLPTSVLEAASLGTAVIVSKATNVAEYVAEFNAGIAIDNNNIKQLEDAFMVFYQNYLKNELESYEIGGKSMLNSVFSWSNLVEQYDHLYQ